MLRIKRVVDPTEKGWSYYVLFRPGEFRTPVAVLNEEDVRVLKDELDLAMKEGTAAG